MGVKREWGYRQIAVIYQTILQSTNFTEDFDWSKKKQHPYNKVVLSRLGENALQHSYHRWKIYVRATDRNHNLQRIIEQVDIKLDECYLQKNRSMGAPKNFRNENGVEVQEYKMEDQSYKSFNFQISVKFRTGVGIIVWCDKHFEISKLFQNFHR